MSETTQTVLFRFQGLEVRGEKSCVGRFIKAACLYNLSAAKTIKILLKFVRAGDSSAMWISRPYHYKFILSAQLRQRANPARTHRLSNSRPLCPEAGILQTPCAFHPANMTFRPEPLANLAARGQNAKYMWGKIWKHTSPPRAASNVRCTCKRHAERRNKHAEYLHIDPLPCVMRSTLHQRSGGSGCFFWNSCPVIR